ncbi:MAG: hypothetical protein WAZ77_09500 [Candidatus Nitrosopolaris sp.]
MINTKLIASIVVAVVALMVVAFALTTLHIYNPCYHKCKRWGMIYECGSNSCGKPFQHDRCFSCSQELFAVTTAITNYRSYGLDKSPVL